MIDPCPDCPAAGRCIVQATGHAPYCDWARAGGRRRERVAELSAGLDADAHDAPRPTVAESVRLTRAMNACPSRSVDPGCGCAGARCSARGGAVVSHLDCFACLAVASP